MTPSFFYYAIIGSKYTEREWVMNNALNLLQQKEWRVIDQTSLGPLFDPLQSFAMDDTLCYSVGSGHSSAVARAWVHHHSVILGIQDAKLPYIKDGLKYLDDLNYRYIVRTSGGLAVVLDEGVLNLTLIFPDTEKGIDIDRGYEAMYQLIVSMFQDLQHPIVAGEIKGSYCPGSFDLSIHGKKFAGISQRRLRKGVAVQIYLCVTDSGGERAEIIKRFYQLSTKGEKTKFSYPTVKPEVMGSLSELSQHRLTIQDVMLRLLQSLKSYSNHLIGSTLTPFEMEAYHEYYGRVKDRNEKMIGNIR